jgi:hypothetical protein
MALRQGTGAYISAYSFDYSAGIKGETHNAEARSIVGQSTRSLTGWAERQSTFAMDTSLGLRT